MGETGEDIGVEAGIVVGEDGPLGGADEGGLLGGADEDESLGAGGAVAEDMGEVGPIGDAGEEAVGTDCDGTVLQLYGQVTTVAMTGMVTVGIEGEAKLTVPTEGVATLAVLTEGEAKVTVLTEGMFMLREGVIAD